MRPLRFDILGCLKELVALFRFGLVSHESDSLLIRGTPDYPTCHARVGIGEIDVWPIWLQGSSSMRQHDAIETEDLSSGSRYHHSTRDMML